MMIGPKNAAIAIRKPDGEIVVEKRPVPKKRQSIETSDNSGICRYFQADGSWNQGADVFGGICGFGG